MLIRSQGALRQLSLHFDKVLRRGGGALLALKFGRKFTIVKQTAVHNSCSINLAVIVDCSSSTSLCSMTLHVFPLLVLLFCFSSDSFALEVLHSIISAIVSKHLNFLGCLGMFIGEVHNVCINAGPLINGNICQN